MKFKGLPDSFPEPHPTELDMVAQLLATPTPPLGGRIEVDEPDPGNFQGRVRVYTWYDDHDVPRQGYRIYEDDETGGRFVKIMQIGGGTPHGTPDYVTESLILKAVLEKHGITAEQMADEAKRLREEV